MPLYLFWYLVLKSIKRKNYFDTYLKCSSFANCNGGLAQLARALAWQARGHRFESGILH